jgi:hypothetical protein
MSLTVIPSTYRQNYRHDGCPKELPSYRHGHICMAVEVTVRRVTDDQR